MGIFLATLKIRTKSSDGL